MDDLLIRRMRRLDQRVSYVETQDSFPASGAPPSGAAGGVLAGTYPNPGFAVGAIVLTSAAISGILPSANGGTGINNAGRTLTVPATGTVALLEVANIFELGQTINESGAASNTRIEGDTDVNLFFADAVNDRIGIGTSAPATKLQLTGPIPASVATSPGTNATGMFRTTGGTGGTTTIATTGIGGDGGSILFTTGTGGQAPAAATASTGGNGGLLQFSTAAGGPASVAGSGINTGGNGGLLSTNAGAGGAASGTSGTAQGGVGSSISFTGGAGGAASGTGTNTGGNGGTLVMSGGAGGSASGGASNTPGNGGAVTLRGGVSSSVAGSAGGSATIQGRASSATGTGGAGGLVSISAGDATGDNTVNRAGGAITSTAGDSKGSSAGGLISFAAGGGGAGTGALGATGGAVTIIAGAGGANATTSGAGGAINIRAGLGGATGTPGAGGDILFQTALTTSLVTRLSIYGSSSGMVVNETGVDYDFRIEGDTDANLFVVDAGVDRIGIGTNTPGARLHVLESDAVTNTITTGVIVDHTSSGTPAAGFGVRGLFQLKSSTTPSQDAASIDAVWTTATHASRSAAIVVSTVNNAGALTERVRLPAPGGLVIGTAALATNATDGFLYVPSCAGTPTGVPTAFTGMVPLIFDTTNLKLYIYSGGWKTTTVFA